MNTNQGGGHIEPQGQMTGAFTAPANNGPQREKNADIQILPAGPQSGIIFCLVDLGTHMEKNFAGTDIEPKRKIQIGFEHPQLKQCYYKDDATARSAATWIESMFSVAEKAKLRKLIEAVVGRTLTDQEAYAYDIAKLFGAKVIVNVKHQQSKTPPNRIYEKVDSIMSHGSFPLPVPFQPENEYWLFAIDPLGNNFKTENFAKLPAFLKKKILDSNEAKEYIAKGGLFAQMPKQENQQQQAQAHAQPMDTPAPANGIIMLVNDYTYEGYKASGWTDEMLVQNGKAKWNIPTPPPLPAPPVAPQAPMAPAGPPAPPTAPSAPPVYNAVPQGMVGSPFEDMDDNDDVPF